MHPETRHGLKKAIFHQLLKEPKLSFLPTFHVKVASTIEEACKLAEIGFEYFTTIESVQIFRKRKWP